MDWKASPPAIEIAATSIAAACLGGAAGFAVARIAPFGAGLAVASAVGAVVALAAWWIVSRVDRRRDSCARLALADLLFEEGGGEDVLLLDQPLDRDDVLLLDDPLPAVESDSRVVRLFAAQPTDSAASSPSLAGPGEMVARIEDFLGVARGGAAAAPVHAAPRATPGDASAALHAALADIRRSLRQG